MKSDMEKETYKISVITVVYNGVKTIERTIKSVLGQSYGNIEYIIIDGNSTDGTQQLVTKYLDSIAYFISEKDSGIYDAMNKGIDRATGDYVIFINSDDWLADNSIGRCIGFLDDSIDVLYGDVCRIYENGIETREKGEFKDINDIICRGICHQAVLAKLKLLKENHFDIHYKIASDYDWLLKIFYQGAKFSYVPIVFSHYCMTGYSVVNHELCAWECFEIANKYLSELDDKGQEKYYPIVNEQHYLQLFERLCETVRGHKLLKNILSNVFSHKEEVVVFGRGNNAEACLKVLNVMEVNVLKIIDNNKEIQGTVYQGIEVVGLDSALSRENKVVVSSTSYEQEIYHQLVINGFRDIVLFSDIKNRVCRMAKTEGKADHEMEK